MGSGREDVVNLSFLFCGALPPPTALLSFFLFEIRSYYTSSLASNTHSPFLSLPSKGITDSPPPHPAPQKLATVMVVAMPYRLVMPAYHPTVQRPQAGNSRPILAS